MFIHCKVKVCNATDPNSRCALGCQSRSKRSMKALPNTPSDVYPLAQGPFALNRKKREVAVADEAILSDQSMRETQSGKYFVLLYQCLCEILKKEMPASLSITFLNVWRQAFVMSVRLVFVINLSFFFRKYFVKCINITSLLFPIFFSRYPCANFYCNGCPSWSVCCRDVVHDVPEQQKSKSISVPAPLRRSTSESLVLRTHS